MLDRAWLVSEVQDFRHVLDIHDLDGQFAKKCQLCTIHRIQRNLLASHGDPISIWRQRNISDGQGAPCEDFIERVRLQGVFADGAILAAGHEEVVLGYVSGRPSEGGSIPYGSSDGGIVVLTVVDGCRLCIRSGVEDANGIVVANGDELGAVGGVAEEGWAGRV
jgi:hypothetical protein